MGVSYEHLVLYGFQFPYEAYDSETCEPYRYRDRDAGDVVVVADGMGGEYLFVGVKQFQSADGRWEQATIPAQTIEEPSEAQVAELDEVLGALGLAPDGEPNHYVFTHFW